VQNLTSYSCSATPISYNGDEILQETDDGRDDRYRMLLHLQWASLKILFTSADKKATQEALPNTNAETLYTHIYSTQCTKITKFTQYIQKSSSCTQISTEIKAKFSLFCHYWYKIIPSGLNIVGRFACGPADAIATHYLLLQ